MEHIILRSGFKLPAVGLGAWKVPDNEAAASVASAVGLGYRLIDTAAIYHNEHGVGEGLRRCGIPREQLRIATKAWNENLRQNRVEQGFEESLSALGLDYADLYLMHWPVPGQYVDCWKTLLRIKREGRAKVVGVCNCSIRHLLELADATGEMPELLQVERHPLLSQEPLLAFCREHGIAMQAYSPLMQGNLSEPTLLAIAESHEKTPAQVVLRWHIQRGVAVIPKSVSPERQAQNLALFDFVLSEQELSQIDALNQNRRYCADPENFDF